MSILDVTVERYRISVSASEALDAVMADFDASAGDALRDAINDMSHYRQGAIISPIGLTITADMAFATSDELPDGTWHCESLSEHAAWQELTDGGYVSARETILTEREGNSYLWDDLHITNVTVARDFQVTPVTYIRDGWGRLAKDAIIRESYVVSAGGYVIAETGTYSTTVHSVGYVEDVNELPTVESLFDVEGFSATRCDAGCDRCGYSWFAESGSWKFELASDHVPWSDHLAFEDVADEDVATTWDFDDATFPDADVRPDYRPNTIVCPNGGCDGLVGFSVY